MDTYIPLVEPLFSGAAKCNTAINPTTGCFTDPCTTCNLLALAGHILDTLIALAVLLAVVLFIYAGWLYLNTSFVDKVTRAHNIFWQTFKGLIIVLAAWLIVDTGLSVLATGGQSYLNGVLLSELFCDARATSDTCTASGTAPGQIQQQPTTTPPPPTDPAGNGGAPPMTCTTCLPIPAGIPIKDGTCPGVPECTVDPSLAPKLSILNSNLAGVGIGWQVTEAFPPSRVHKAACHNAGTCIDANFTSAPTVDTVETFIAASQDAGLRPVYETNDQAMYNQLIADSRIPAGSVLFLPTCSGGSGACITAPHFSVYGN